MGDGLPWDDAKVRAHPRGSGAKRDAFWKAGRPKVAQDNVTAQFQTCLTIDGLVDRSLDAVSDLRLDHARRRPGASAAPGLV